MLSIVWISIVSLLTIKDVTLYNLVLTKKDLDKPPKDALKILERCKNKLNITKEIGLVIQDKIKTPSLYGVLKPKILLTKEIVDSSDYELECIILHELTHYKYHHNTLYLFFSFLERIYFFNPFMQFAFKNIRRDMECITDTFVLENGIEIRKYSKLIIKISQFSTVVSLPLPSVCNEKQELERRIKNMKNKIVDSKYAFVIIFFTLAMMSLVTISLASNKIENITDDVLEGNMKLDEEINSENIELILPLKNPKVTSPFSKRIHPITNEEFFHTGVDIISDVSDEVVAVADGKVIFTGYDAKYGNNIKIEHKDGTISFYAHGLEIFVNKGDEIKAGEKIMLVGSTGLATGPHLHFEMLDVNGEYIDINSLFQ